MTRKGTLAGLFYEYFRQENKVMLNFVSVSGNTTLIQQMAEGLIKIVDVPDVCWINIKIHEAYDTDSLISILIVTYLK